MHGTELAGRMGGSDGAKRRVAGQERGTGRLARGLSRLPVTLLVPVVVAGLVALAVPARALDDIANLKGMGVVAAGQVKRMDCPASGRFNCNSWPSNFLKFEYENICFATDPGVCGAYCKGILATDKSKSVYFFESLPGGDLAQRRARGYECPPGF
jgi:hypothetical protein